jgi:glycerophosphoryl diester phosphodiesterase
MANPWLDRRVLHYAHRGGSREAPSSTLLAMRQALARGADVLEMDVHATLDGHLVVCHDPTVDATTNGSGAIAAMTLAQVQALDNAYWWVEGEVAVTDAPASAYVYRGRAPDDHDLRVPTLREVLEALPGIPLNLDIKQTTPTVKPYEAALAALLDEFGRSDDVIVTSFLDSAIATFAALAPAVGRAAGPLTLAECWQAARQGQPLPIADPGLVALQVPLTFGSLPVVEEGLIAAAHAAGLAVHVWTIDDPAEMESLIDLDVDGIMTDRPGVLETVLQQRGVAWVH